MKLALICIAIIVIIAIIAWLAYELKHAPVIDDDGRVVEGKT